MTFHWKHLTTEQRIEAIKAVYTFGASASEIAAALGGVTRNSVIGMYGRHQTALSDCPLGGGVRRVADGKHKLACRPKAERKPKRPVRLPDLSAPRPVRAPSPLPPTVDYVSRDVPLLDLAPSDCRWPTNDAARGEQHLFCGHTRLLGYSWCERHYSRAFDASQTTGR